LAQVKPNSGIERPALATATSPDPAPNPALSCWNIATSGDYTCAMQAY